MATLDKIISINPGYRTSGEKYVKLHASDASRLAPESDKCVSVHASDRVNMRRMRTAPVMQMTFGMVIIAAGLLNFVGQVSPLFML